MTRLGCVLLAIATLRHADAFASGCTSCAKLYVARHKAFLEVFDVMHNSCEKGDTPFAVTSAKNAAHMRAFLAKQKPGLYALNAFAGPTAWTHGGSVAHSTELGHLNGHNKWTASAGIPQQQAYFRQHYGGNHNVQCGASRPSWDPVLARVSDGSDPTQAKRGVVEFPRSTNDKTSVLNCYHDGYDSKVSVLCQRRGPPLACSDFSAINRACPVHALGRLVPSVCDNTQDDLDNSCKGTFQDWYSRCAKSTAMRFLPTTLKAQLHEFAMICSTAPTYFVRDEAYTLSKGTELALLPSLPVDYSVSLTIKPGKSKRKSWSSIVHFSATNQNYGHLGDRVPGIWFYPNSRRLHIIDGHASDANDECPITTELKPGVETQVRVEFSRVSVKVFIDGIVKCRELRKDRKPLTKVHVYASDPWYEPADAAITNFALDPQRDYYFAEEASRGGKGPMQLTKGSKLATVAVLPVHYSISLDITPGRSIRRSWGNILHLSATHHDCCNYGDRIPGVWFYPGTRRLYVIDGHSGPSETGTSKKRSGSGHDDECPIAKQLSAGKKTSLRIEMSETRMSVFVDGHLACDEPRHGRKPFTDVEVFASDPWYTPADATIDNFEMHVGGARPLLKASAPSCAGVAPYTTWSDQRSDPKHGNACFKPGGPGKGGGDWQCPVGCKKVSRVPWCGEAKRDTTPCRVAETVAGTAVFGTIITSAPTTGAGGGH